MWVKVIDRSHPYLGYQAYVTSLGVRYSVKYWMDPKGKITLGGKRILYPWQIRQEAGPKRVTVGGEGPTNECLGEGEKGGEGEGPGKGE